MKPTHTILLKEKDNKAFVYLYSYKCRAWIAYEQSAIYLNTLLPHISLHKQRAKNCGPVMVVDRLSLEWLLVKLPPLNRTTEDIVFRMPEELLRII